MKNLGLYSFTLEEQNFDVIRRLGTFLESPSLKLESAKLLNLERFLKLKN